MRTKVCKSCGRELPLDEFNHSKRSPDGHYHLCRDCWNKKQKEYDLKRKLKNLEIEVSPAEIEIIPVIEKKEKNEVKPKNVTATPVVKFEPPTLSSIPDSELIQELKGRGISVLIDPKPRDLISKLKSLGYVGTLEYYEKRTIDLKSFV